MKGFRCIGLALAASLSLSACAPLLFTGAFVGSTMVVSDRRSVGIQLEDEAIERRINRSVADRYERGTLNVNVMSFNRKVLLAGQVASDAQRAEIEQIALRAENVRSVVNELEVGPVLAVGARATDTATTGKVRAALLEARDVPTGAVKLTTERGVVYLLGRVTEAEADAAARATSRVSGVQRVVKVFDYLSEEDAAQYRRNTPPPETPRRP
jgi:osmotically-inducible protein OsmY